MRFRLLKAALGILAAGAAIGLATPASLAQVSDPTGSTVAFNDFGAYNQGRGGEVGIASWYGGRKQRGHRTANGERFDEEQLTAAHPSLPFATHVRVTNLANGRSVVVRINDRNATYTGRVIDLSRRAAEMLGMRSAGTALVAVVPVDEEVTPVHLVRPKPHRSATRYKAAHPS